MNFRICEVLTGIDRKLVKFQTFDLVEYFYEGVDNINPFDLQQKIKYGSFTF